MLKKIDCVRPDRIVEAPLPPVPEVDASNSGLASVQPSEHRTTLSTHRTGLSEHRTDLSEYRTDLSTYRTDLSTERTEMAMRRTGMALQRTRMAADRTLMAVIRTSLSLISFGFTIFQVFQRLRDQAVLSSAAPARNFGVTLVLLGIATLVVGIAYHVQFMLGLRKERDVLMADGLIYGQSKFPPSMTLIIAVVLLVIGVIAIVNMVFHIGPFG